MGRKLAIVVAGAAACLVAFGSPAFASTSHDRDDVNINDSGNEQAQVGLVNLQDLDVLSGIID
ncbi:hypothetical protein [Pseudonocardia sp. HH130630-07]|uniref:hypothetical protein n=1 Tax=Pseudonocardia sp. HH130630-07 TaxID=1690815 RepID=UPI0008150FA6|nr:hypothetical protein [Pseudonocardia sp. HH130630-07]ANY05581.1 hypothetical protein AFB00_03840 [Pseudonocardia sp. HH130630-07]